MERAELHVRSGPRAGEVVTLDPARALVFGRDFTVDVQVVDSALSRQHFRIEPLGPGQWVLVDMMSSNGTFVNDRRVNRAPLNHGDLIQAGASSFGVVVPNHGTRIARLVDDGFEAADANFCQAVDFDSGALIKGKTGAADAGAKGALDVIFEVSERINSEHDPRKLFALIADLILGVITCDRVSVLLYQPATRQVDVAALALRPGAGLDAQTAISRSVSLKVIHEGVTIALQDTRGDTEFGAMQSIVSLNIASVACAPLAGRQEVLGAIYCDRIGALAVFSEIEVNLLAAVGKLAGVAVERARLAEQALEHERLKHGLEIARNIQRSLLPARIPQVPGVDLAGFSKPCDETGGDYYDFYLHADGTLALVVGDVSGHGVGSALLMATARAFLKAGALEGSDPGRLLAKVNILLEADTDDEHFMTLFYGVYDPRRGALTYASAGHDEPIFYKPALKKAFQLDSTGMPLGMLAGAEFEVKAHIRVDPGDVLVIVTDGVWEAMNAAGESYGKPRLATLIQRSAMLTASDLVTAILQDVRDFVGATPLRDDLTLIVARFLDPRAPAAASGEHG